MTLTLLRAFLSDTMHLLTRADYLKLVMSDEWLTRFRASHRED